MATVRIYKVAELLNTSSQEVMALLKRDHGIEVKSASSTIEEVVARQFVERLARQRNIPVPSSASFADAPAPVRGRKPAPKAPEPQRPATPALPPPRLVKTAKPAAPAVDMDPETIAAAESVMVPAVDYLRPTPASRNRRRKPAPGPSGPAKPPTPAPAVEEQVVAARAVERHPWSSRVAGQKMVEAPAPDTETAAATGCRRRRQASSVRRQRPRRRRRRLAR